MALGWVNASSASAYPIYIRDYLWDSYIFQQTEGFESRRWEDGSYSEILFNQCGGGSAVTIQMRMDVNNAPDKGYDNKTFTACYGTLGQWSQGEWSDLPSTTNNSSEYYFQINDIRGDDEFSAGKVLVDDTAAD
ncbi:hypothetical protein EJ357_28015 [Streptomyces cyaneochromogenes]|uniref:Uncharacterized protein n=1 Tax=Streptomyces cyaneochromogenes TaxID=2496836 RepID=A0A3Q9EVA3_9ACTN|nr:hypothetical protein [Streptomyces cyaneochromogenes]AZQ36820.1 hypothetical protein EJ357_28015 [Streptomyces cyaneochromogenes]